MKATQHQAPADTLHRAGAASLWGFLAKKIGNLNTRKHKTNPRCYTPAEQSSSEVSRSWEARKDSGLFQLGGFSGDMTARCEVGSYLDPGRETDAVRSLARLADWLFVSSLPAPWF